MVSILSGKGGVNWRLPAWHEDMGKRNQCVMMQNLRYHKDFFESVPGTRKFHGTSVGTSPITAIMPYYNDQTDDFKLLMASGDSIYKRNEASNEFETLISALSPNSIYSSAIRYDTMYIPSVKDGLKKYLGGNQIEPVGGGSTAPGNFRQVLYMKEIDRLFGISDDAIFGQISWCESGQPENWDGASVERFKLKDGERVEGGEVLYGKLIVFCTYSVWIYYVSGNEENWKLEEAPTTIGCVAPNTIKKFGNKIYYLGESPRSQLGVYSFNGSTSDLLTDDMHPFFELANPNKKRNACAEIHDDLYTVSLAVGFSETNNYSVDLDLVNLKEDGTPAMYGPHTFAFYSSAVLNGRQNDKEFLMGDESDGFVYYESGTTLKSVNGNDGQLLQNRFLSRIHNDENFEMMKRYQNISVYYRPTGSFNGILKYYLSNGSNPYEMRFNPNIQSFGYAGDFNVYEKPLFSIPGIYPFMEFPGVEALGTSIQIELLNNIIGERLNFDGYGYQAKEVHKVRRAQVYAN